MEHTHQRATGGLSVEEFERLPEEDGYRLELSAGLLVREPPPGTAHGWLSTEIAARLWAHVRASVDGLVLTNAGFVLTEEPATVRAPDIAFVAGSRRAALEPGIWRGPPDLAVEINSPSNSASDIQAKVRQYLSAGVRLVWVVDPPSRTVTVYRSADDIRLLGLEGVLDGGNVLPGFRLPLATLFGEGA